MKKLFVFLLSTSLLFTSCQLFDSTFKDEPGLTSYEGVLSEIPESSELSGTHLLESGDGEDISLRSLSINLSNSQYLGNEVSVLGVINEEDGVVEVTGVSVLKVLVEGNGDGKFVEYKNTDLGFTLKYYDDWEVNESVDEVEFTSPEENGFSDEVTISQFPFSYSANDPEEEMTAGLKAYFKERYPEMDSENMMRKVGVDEMDSVRVEENGEGIRYYLYRNGLVYLISFEPETDNSVAKENERIFNEMLAEFRFLGFTVEGDSDVQAENLEELPEIDMELTYFESRPYSFRASYPVNWYYAGSTGGSDVLWHYGFSDESVTPENELVSLDVLSGDMPSGSISTYFDGNEVRYVEPGASGLPGSFYTKVGGYVFRVFGPLEYDDLMLNMIVSIKEIEKGD